MTQRAGCLSAGLAACCAVLGLAGVPRSAAGTVLPATTTPAPAAAATGAIGSGADRIGALVQMLGADDPASRNDAAGQLMSIGAAARPALLRAAASHDPELRLRAEQLVLQLPWYSADDPPPVRQILAHYSRDDEHTRVAAVARLASLDDAQGDAALLRLLDEEPADSVRWAICRVLRTRAHPTVMEQLRRMDTTGQRAPVVAAAGWAWLRVEPARAVGLLHEAIELDARHPARDYWELAAIFDLLQARARIDHHYGDAAQLLRAQLARGEASAPARDATVFALLALQADHGPLEGLQSDLADNADLLGTAPGLYALGRLMQRCGSPYLADALYDRAANTAPDDATAHYRSGELLLSQRWLDLAQREFERVVVLGQSDPAAGSLAVNAHFRLASIMNLRGDDFATAQQMSMGMRAMQDPNGPLLARRPPGAPPPQGDDAATRAIWAEIHLHYLRAARGRGDQAEVQRQLADLLDLGDDADAIASELVPILKEMHREAEATAMFERSRKALLDRLEQSSDDAESANNLAWLDARCGQHLDEAVELAQRAVDASPGSAAYLDTLAEAHFRSGHHQRAIEIETRALELQPGDVFMQGQLARFRAAP